MRTNHKFTSKIISQPGPRASRDADAVSVAAPPNEQARNREKEKRIQRRRETSSSRSFDSIDCSIDEDAVAGPTESKSNPPVQLLRNYDMVIETILSEMNRTQSGDRVEFSVYVLEPGESTNKVIASMRAAAKRGVRVDCSLDCSIVSAFTRWCEGTKTEAEQLFKLAAEFPDDEAKSSSAALSKKPKKGVVTFSPRTLPTHAKYVVFHRQSAVSTAVFGGVNIGDRFRNWRDFAIRCEGRAAVGALAMCVNGEARVFESRTASGPVNSKIKVTSPSSSASSPRVATSGQVTTSGQTSSGSRLDKFKSFLTVGSRDRNKARDAEARANGLGFVANTPSAFDIGSYIAPWAKSFPGKYDVLPSIMRLLSDKRYDEYVIAAAYLDTWGSRVLRLALDRGANIMLVMPRVPNVYRDANAKALKGLMDGYGREEQSTDHSTGGMRDEGIGGMRKQSDEFLRKQSKGRLVSYICDDMLHAKVFLARDSSGKSPDACMIGSCNLKQRSFGQFAELNALIVQPGVARQLGDELVAIITASEKVEIGSEALRYAEPKATIEEWCG